MPRKAVFDSFCWGIEPWDASKVEAALKARLKTLGKPLVTQADVRKLTEIESAEAQKREVEVFHYGTNEEMLEKIMSVG